MHGPSTRIGRLVIRIPAASALVRRRDFRTLARTVGAALGGASASRSQIAVRIENVSTDDGVGTTRSTVAALIRAMR